MVFAALLVDPTASAPYDPWSGLDADGDIDIFDIVKIAGSLATTGDPCKNVTVASYATRHATQSVSVAGHA